jgi:EVE domain
MAAYWLIVERYENWLVDEAGNFRHFGVAERKQTIAAKIKPGDLLVVYVSGKGCFSDLRRVLSPPMIKLKGGGPYDAAFSTALSTEPFVTLKKDSWVPAKDVAAKLSFLSSTDWRQSFRNSLRQIPEADGRFLEKTLTQAGKIAANLPKRLSHSL